jgi:hypothetical protein
MTDTFGVSLRRMCEVALGVLVAICLQSFVQWQFTPSKARDAEAEKFFKSDCLKRGGDLYEGFDSPPTCMGAKSP